MKNIEFDLLNAYMEIKTAIAYVNRFSGDYGGLFDSLDLLKNAAIKSAQDNKCKCGDHNLAVAGTYWRPPFSFDVFKAPAPVEIIPVIFNFCPECGRKF